MRFQSYTGREDSESTWGGLNLDRIVFSCSIMIPQGSVQLFNKVLIQPCVWGLILIVRVSWRMILVDVCVLCVWTWVWMEDYWVLLMIRGVWNGTRVFRDAQTLNVTSHPPERKREKRRTREKPDTTETKTHTEELKTNARSCMRNIRGTSVWSWTEVYFITILSWIMGMFRTCYGRTCWSVFIWCFDVWRSFSVCFPP